MKWRVSSADGASMLLPRRANPCKLIGVREAKEERVEDGMKVAREVER